MVDREGVVFHSHLHATRVGEFLTMNLAAHAMLETCLEDAGSLFGGKEPLVAEHIHKVGKAFLGHGGNHLVDHKVHILSLSPCIFAPHGMCT